MKYPFSKYDLFLLIGTNLSKKWQISTPPLIEKQFSFTHTAIRTKDEYFFVELKI